MADRGNIYFWFLNPESCIPKIFYGLQPITALRCGIIYVYKLLFGQEDCNKIRCGLAAIPIKMHAPFQKYFEMVKETWSHGRPAKIQKQLGSTLQIVFLLDLIENLNVGKMSCLNFSSTEIDSNMRMSTVTQGRLMRRAVVQEKIGSHPYNVSYVSTALCVGKCQKIKLNLKSI